jgi:hypothetical protein
MCLSTFSARSGNLAVSAALLKVIALGRWGGWEAGLMEAPISRKVGFVYDDL